MNDLDRWQELKNGNPKALEEIYSGEVTHLLRYGNKFSNDAQLVEDCIHDLFIELWKNREGLSATDSIRRYLLVAIRRKIIRRIEQQKKRLSNEEPQEYHFEAEISVDMEIIQEETNAAQLKELKSALEGLSSRQKEVIYLKYFTGMDYEAIGAIMDINYQSVRNLVSKALKSLKEHMMLFWIIILNFL